MYNASKFCIVSNSLLTEFYVAFCKFLFYLGIIIIFYFAGIYNMTWFVSKDIFTRTLVALRLLADFCKLPERVGAAKIGSENGHEPPCALT